MSFCTEEIPDEIRRRIGDAPTERFDVLGCDIVLAADIRKSEEHLRDCREAMEGRAVREVEVGGGVEGEDTAKLVVPRRIHPRRRRD